MSVAVLADVDAAAARPVRVPKLAVRNRSVDNGDALARPATATTVATEGSGDSARVPSESSSLRAPSPGGRRRLSDQSGGSGSSGMAARNGSTARPSTATKPAEPAKKKKSGMLGFFTMKEPSAMALEEFAEAQRKKAQEKGSSVVNVSGVSSRKLPEHVPKVNSKWDGLPENAKKQSSEARSLRSRGDSNATSAGRRPSTQYSSWSNRSDESKRPWGSLSSRPPQSPQLAQRSSLQSRGTVSSTHSARAPILNNNINPAFKPIAVEETPENLPQTFLHPPSPPATRHRQRQSSPRQHPTSMHELPASFGAVPELETSDGPLPELESSFIAAQELDALRSRDATPVPKSPITPSVDDTGAANYYAHTLAGSYGAAAAEDSTTFLYSQSDTDHEDFASRSGNSCGGGGASSTTPKQLRQPINFSRRRTGKARPPSLGKLPEASALPPSAGGFTFLTPPGDEQPPILSSTLKGSDGRIDPFLTDTFAAVSRETGRIVERQPQQQQQQQQQQYGAGGGGPGVGSGWEDPTRASMSTYVSATTATGGVQSPVFSTAPTDSTRPSTAASQMSTGTQIAGEGEEQHKHHSFSDTNHSDPYNNDDDEEEDDDDDDEGPDEYYTNPSHPHPHRRDSERRNSDSSLAPSLAPSAMSAQWTLSPKERLGLGSRIRRDDEVGRSPWEDDTVSRLRERNARITVGGSGGGGGMLSPSAPPTAVTPATPTEGKFKRLSYRWGGGGGERGKR